MDVQEVRADLRDAVLELIRDIEEKRAQTRALFEDLKQTIRTIDKS
jgi:hypothetical protein